MQFRKQWVTAIAILFLFVASASYLLRDRARNEEEVASKLPEGEVVSNQATSSKVKEINGRGLVDISGIGIEGVEGVEVKVLPHQGSLGNVLQPALTRPVSVPAIFPTDVKERLLKNLAENIKALKANPDDFGTWLNLAQLRKMIEDYEGAREIWEYLNRTNPNQSISFGNLGELYHLYLKDYPKAEVNYRTAIRNEPIRVTLYRSLHELYRYSYKQDTGAAVGILLEGLSRNPNHPDFLILLAHYYRDKSDVVNARKYYEQALEVALKNGNKELASILEGDLERLTQ